MIETIEKVSSEALEQVLEDYISWSAGWDRSLPPDVSFGVWADLQQEKKPLEIHARFVEGQLQFTSSVEGVIKVADNSIYLENGRQLVTQLQGPTSRLLHDDKMPVGISDGLCVIRCSQMPYLRLSRYMLANCSAVEMPPLSSSLPQREVVEPIHRSSCQQCVLKQVNPMVQIKKSGHLLNR